MKIKIWARLVPKSKSWLTYLHTSQFEGAEYEHDCTAQKMKFSINDFLSNLWPNPQETLACNFTKKETLAQVSSCEFCDISKNTFFTEHFWTAASKTIHKRGYRHFKLFWDIL